MEELKEMCRQKKISGYSKLNKEDLLKLVKKKSKAKSEKVKKRFDNFILYNNRLLTKI